MTDSKYPGPYVVLTPKTMATFYTMQDALEAYRECIASKVHYCEVYCKTSAKTVFSFSCENRKGS